MQDFYFYLYDNPEKFLTIYSKNDRMVIEIGDQTIGGIYLVDYKSIIYYYLCWCFIVWYTDEENIYPLPDNFLENMTKDFYSNDHRGDFSLSLNEYNKLKVESKNDLDDQYREWLSGRDLHDVLKMNPEFVY